MADDHPEVRRTWRNRGLGALLGTALALLLLPVLQQGYNLALPASWWVTVDELHVADAAEGAVPEVTFRRTIRRPFTGDWIATVRKVTAEGLLTICVRNGSRDYIPEASARPSATLDTIMGARLGGAPCAALEPGRYVLTMAWVIQAAGLDPKALRVRSNEFEVRR